MYIVVTVWIWPSPISWRTNRLNRTWLILYMSICPSIGWISGFHTGFFWWGNKFVGSVVHMLDRTWPLFCISDHLFPGELVNQQVCSVDYTWPLFHMFIHWMDLSPTLWWTNRYVYCAWSYLTFILHECLSIHRMIGGSNVSWLNLVLYAFIDIGEVVENDRKWVDLTCYAMSSLCLIHMQVTTGCRTMVKYVHTFFE